MSNIAFFGLGIMGSGMAHNLIKQGHTLAVYNRTRERAASHLALGARHAHTPADAARDADVVISMVSDDAASRRVWLGAEGALGSALPGTLLIESSTLTPGWIVELAQLAEARNCELLDAPVTGSKVQAESGKLGFLVGGSEATLERARPILTAMGKTIHHFGPNGSGAMMKLINNMVAGVQLVALCEGLALAEQSGLNLDQVGTFLMEGPPGSPLVKRKTPTLLAHDYTPHFSLRLMHKDFTYGLAEAAQRNVPTPTIAAARELMRLGLARGWGDQDNGVMYELLRPKSS